ncbi:MAG TPA: hypothetical protein DCE08_01935 [Ruminococcaceae bacterium]|nr:hypothetical protein [Oscillospiraceae bacterium]
MPLDTRGNNRVYCKKRGKILQRRTVWNTNVFSAVFCSAVLCFTAFTAPIISVTTAHRCTTSASCFRGTVCSSPSGRPFR